MILSLILFVQFNKKGLHTILNRYVQHDRLIPQMKLVPFQVVEITVGTASTPCLQGDDRNDKKKCEVIGENIHFKYLLFKNVNAFVFLHALAGLERAVLGFLGTCGSAVCSPGKREMHLGSGYCFLLLAVIHRFGVDMRIDRVLWREPYGVNMASLLLRRHFLQMCPADTSLIMF